MILKRSSLQKYEFEPLVTTPISVYEVFEGVFRKGNKRNQNSASNLFEQSIILKTNSHASVIAAKIQSHLFSISKPIERSDSLMIGTFISNGCKKIVTRNTKHFKRMKGIKIISY